MVKPDSKNKSWNFGVPLPLCTSAFCPLASWRIWPFARPVDSPVFVIAFAAMAFTVVRFNVPNKPAKRAALKLAAEPGKGNVKALVSALYFDDRQVQEAISTKLMASLD